MGCCEFMMFILIHGGQFCFALKLPRNRNCLPTYKLRSLQTTNDQAENYNMISSCFDESSNLNLVVPGAKNKKGPLPMKLRALPQSFWQQPNTLAEVPPTVCSPPLHDEIEPTTQSEVIGVPNTELLFSLFHVVEVNVSEKANTKSLSISKRGRPRKLKSKFNLRVKRDIDPYFNSATVPNIQVGENEKICERQKVLALVSVTGEAENLNSNSSYSEKLSDLVVNL